VMAFAQKGAFVVIADRDYEGAIAAQKSVEKLNNGARAIAVKTDVTKPEELKSLVERAVREFGRIDIMVQSVGWYEDLIFVNKSLDIMQKEIDINLWGVIYGFMAVLPVMQQQKEGSIICLASDAGRIGFKRGAVYAAAKAGIIALVKSLALENGRFNIRINTVCPSLTIPSENTPVSAFSMWSKGEEGSAGKMYNNPKILKEVVKNYPLGRLGTSEDIARTVAFLGSKDANFITGQTISVNGGFAML